MPKSQEEKNDITASLKKLEHIVSWFEEQDEVDVEEGLQRVKEGAVLIKDLKNRLKKVENEFEEIKKDLTEDDED